MLLERFKNHYKRYEKLYLLGILLFFFLLRFAYIDVYGNYDKSTFKDAAGNNNYAKLILHGTEWITHKDFAGAPQEPLYPIFLAFIYSIFGEENFFAVYIIQAFLSALGLYLIYKIAFVVVKRRSVALLSLVWAGFYMFYFRWIGELLREVLVYFLMLLLFYSLALLFQRKQIKIKHLIIPSFLYTLLIHADGRYLFYAPFLLILFLLYSRPFLPALKQYIIFGIMVLILTIPMTIRNYLAYKQVIIVSEYTINLSKPKDTPRKELFNFAPIDSAYTTYHFGYNANYPTEEERNLVKQGQNPNHRSPIELKAIKEDKRAGTTWLERKWYFFKIMWSPVNTGFGYAPFPVADFNEPASLRHNLLSALEYGLLIPFALLTLIWGFINHKRKYALLFIPIIAQMLLHFITFGIVRYRVPIDGFLIILGCTGMIIVFDAIRNNMKIKGMLNKQH